MLRLVVVLPAVVLSCMDLTSAFTRPYFGGSAAAVAITVSRKPPPGWSGFCGTPYADESAIGQGITLESGLANRFGDVHGLCAADRAASKWNTVWESVRLGVGARVRVPDSVRNPVKPFVGAGVTAGWGRYLEAHNSKLSAGYFGEFGLQVVTRGHWRPALMMRFDRFAARPRYASSIVDGATYFSAKLALFRML